MNALGKDAVVLSHGVFPVSQRRGQVAIGSGGLPPLDFLSAPRYNTYSLSIANPRSIATAAREC